MEFFGRRVKSGGFFLCLGVCRTGRPSAWGGPGRAGAARRGAEVSAAVCFAALQKEIWKTRSNTLLSAQQSSPLSTPLGCSRQPSKQLDSFRSVPHF